MPKASIATICGLIALVGVAVQGALADEPRSHSDPELHYPMSVAEWRYVAGEEEATWIQDHPSPVKPTGPGFRQFVRAQGEAVSELDFLAERSSAATSNETSSTTAADGFGSTFVNLRAPQEHLKGFNDVSREAFKLDDDINDGTNLEIIGPDGNPIIVDIINEDDSFNGGAFFTADDNSDGAFTLGVDPFFVDVGDARELNIRFNTLETFQERRFRSIDLVGQHLWRRDRGILNRRPAPRLGYFGPLVDAELGMLPVAERSPLNARHQQESNWLDKLASAYYVGYGLRANVGLDRFHVQGVGDFLGETFIRTDIDHVSIGPQLLAGWIVSWGPLMFDLSGHAMIGYGRADFDQSYSIGGGLVPPRVNNPIVAQPTDGRKEQVEEYFASHFELRLTTSYLVWHNWSIDTTLRGFISGPWYDSSESIDYTLPNVSLAPGGSDYLAGGNVFVGATYLR